MREVRVLLAMLGAPAAWAVHLLASYAIVGVGCMTGARGTVVLLVVTTVLCALAAASAGLLAFRSRVRRAGFDIGDASSARDLLLDIGLVASGMFLLVILVAGLGPLFVPICPEAA